MIFAGGCHCGAVEVRFETRKAPRDWIIRACQCAFCRKVDALSTSDPDGTIEFFAHPPDALHRYRFDSRTADFLICARCGVYVGATMETPGGRLGIVNVRALHPRLDGLPAAQPMNYDGESTAQRTERRQQRWSPARLS